MHPVYYKNLKLLTTDRRDCSIYSRHFDYYDFLEAQLNSNLT